MNTVGCDSSNAWRESPVEKALPGEYVVESEHGRFYETFTFSVRERRDWLLAHHQEAYQTFLFDDTTIYYVGPLTEEEEIVMAWIKAGENNDPGTVS